MNKKYKLIDGDLSLWVLLSLLAIFSFFPVFSASSNLAYVVGEGTPWYYLFKHMVILIFGFGFMIGVHKIPYQYFKAISILSLPVVVLLLIYTASQGTVIDGANASRWIRIPFVGFSFQTSTLASVVLMIYVAHYLSKNYENPQSFNDSILPLWLPVFIVVSLILPSNFSTAALISVMVFMLAFLGGYPIRYLGVMIGCALLLALLFVLSAKAFPDLIPNRVDTWVSRIESFSQSDDQSVDNYQIERAKIAIATGGVTGLGVGKSVMKNFLPQSSSDFIYAIIVEEFGLLGGIGLIFSYLLILFRIMVIANRTTSVFGKLVVIGVGIPIIFQAMINMGVALQVLPVTGQTLPMVSSGGTSAWMTCVAFGVILSVSSAYYKKEEKTEPKASNEDNPLAILSETI
ncbi:MAG: FtsW/RodA/SpoVE family cell cycle protein [Flavobacteriaceae bacterium]|nr:FtsW/RodA/SpoVE family cell cycle protein [Flavobacteriaceae bacterium]